MLFKGAYSMKPILTRQFMYTIGIILLAAFFSACGSNPATSTVTTQPTTQPTPTPTQAATPTPPPTPTPIPATNTGVTFQQFSGANFTINYATGWQTNHVAQQNAQQKENIYAFVAQDNITGLHIVRNGDEQAPGGMINQLLGGVFTCQSGDASVPAQVTVGGVTWSQVDKVCYLASTYYEVRELVTSSPQYGQTVILYGAYQQVGNGAVAPDFAHASKLYFEPMLASFKFA